MPIFDLGESEGDDDEDDTEDKRTALPADAPAGHVHVVYHHSISTVDSSASYYDVVLAWCRSERHNLKPAAIPKLCLGDPSVINATLNHARVRALMGIRRRLLAEIPVDTGGDVYDSRSSRRLIFDCRGRRII